MKDVRIEIGFLIECKYQNTTFVLKIKKINKTYLQTPFQTEIVQNIIL